MSFKLDGGDLGENIMNAAFVGLRDFFGRRMRAIF